MLPHRTDHRGSNCSVGESAQRRLLLMFRLQIYELFQYKRTKTGKKLYLCPVMLWHSNMQSLSFTERFDRLEEDAQQDEGNAEVEREVDFTTFAKDEEGQNDSIAGF